jgi:D-alanyl-D-alanine carboxypeptidase
MKPFSVIWAFLILVASPAYADPFRLQLPQGGHAHVLYLAHDQTEHILTSGRLTPDGRDVLHDDVFLTASVGKLYLAVAMLRLHEKGVIDIDASVTTYLADDLIGHISGIDDVTLAHLLTMSSGIPDYLDMAFVWRDKMSNVPARDAITSLDSTELMFTPGSDFDYSNTNYVLAQLVIEAQVAPFAQVLQEEIFDNIGDRDAYIIGTASAPDNLALHKRGLWGYYTDPGYGDGAIVTTAKGVAQFYRALFHEQSLLSQASLQRLLHDPIGDGYGMGVVVENTPELGSIYAHDGADLGYQAVVIYRVDTGDIAVHLTTDERDQDDYAMDALYQVCTTC